MRGKAVRGGAGPPRCPPPADPGQAFGCPPEAPGRGPVGADREMEFPVRMFGLKSGQGFNGVDAPLAEHLPRVDAGNAPPTFGQGGDQPDAQHAQAFLGRGARAGLERGVISRDDEDAAGPDALGRGDEQGGVPDMGRVEAPAEDQDLHAMIVLNLPERFPWLIGYPNAGQEKVELRMARRKGELLSSGARKAW